MFSTREATENFPNASRRILHILGSSGNYLTREGVILKTTSTRLVVCIIPIWEY